MGVFDFLKKGKKKEFPAFPKLPHRIPQLPKYESPLKEFRAPIEPPTQPIVKTPIPIRLPPIREPLIREPFREEPPIPRSPQPIYIKLSKYKLAVAKIKEINLKLQEAEKTLSELTEIKVREDAEIAKWQQEIASIKGKLMEVDKNLFEA